MSASDQPIGLRLFAPNGRMGKAMAMVVEADPAFEIVEDGEDVLVDFSVPQALNESLGLARSDGVPILIGTTGLDEYADALIADTATSIPVLRAPNTSVGVAVLADLVERAAAVLGPDWDIEIAETHHRMKADAPSGTALLLGFAAARGRGTELHPEWGRAGRDLTREPGAIGFASLRGGTAAGDHDVMFLGEKERIILSHCAENRLIFARGALAGARFLLGKPAGLYTMRDVIGSL